MKYINGKISNGSYKIISDYKLDNNTRTLVSALDSIVQEYKTLKEKKN